MKLTLLIATLLFILPSGLTMAKPSDTYSRRGFIENSGQITDQHHIQRSDVDAVYAGKGGLSIYVGSGKLHYQFNQMKNKPASFPPVNAGRHEMSVLSTYRVDVSLVGANPAARLIKEQQSSYFERYIQPWLPTGEAISHCFEKLTYKDVYPGIDWVLLAGNGSVKSEFHIGPGGNPALIRIVYQGATSCTLDSNGNLNVYTPLGKIVEDAPFTFAGNGAEIPNRYALKGDTLTYVLDGHPDRFVIDPGVSWATYCGDGGDDWALSVVADNSGNVYTCGATSSTASIATSGAYQNTFAGVEDCFLLKTNSSGARLWATYYGGTTDEEPYTLALDGSGNVYMAGWTTSTSGIATSGSYQFTYGGGSWDSYIVKFGSTGSRIWGTYFGGSGQEEGWGIAIDASGNIYLTGNTTSTTGIATSGTHQPAFAGYYDCFLAKFNNSGSSLLWGTYYGGSDDEFGSQIAIDPSGNVFVDGYTASTTGIATSGAHQGTIGSTTTYDAFLAKFNSTGTLAWGTYFGGNAEDRAYGVITDATGNVYLSGFTESSTGISTTGSFMPVYNGNQDGMLVRFNTAGNRQWGTYLGSTGYDPAQSVGINTFGFLFVTGRTNSSSGIATTGTWQVTLGGGTADAYLMKFDTAGHQQWATYYGGEGIEFGTAVATSGTSAYLAGGTSSSLAIGVASGFDTTYGGGATDAYLARFNDCIPGIVAAILGADTLCVSDSILLACATTGGSWWVDDPSIATVTAGIVKGLSAGTAHITYAVPSGCGSAFSFRTITVYAPPATGIISGPDSVYTGAAITLTGTPAGGHWSATNTRATVSSAGVVTGISAGLDTVCYTITNIHGCTATDSFVVRVLLLSGVEAAQPITQEICISPNPAYNKLVITGNFNALLPTTVCDLTGRDYQLPIPCFIEGKITIDATSLPAGNYLLRIAGYKPLLFMRQ